MINKSPGPVTCYYYKLSHFYGVMFTYIASSKCISTLILDVILYTVCKLLHTLRVSSIGN
jgi:hypothetical protein